jgi:hypothetical protein
MNTTIVHTIIKLLENKNIIFEKGLSNEEYNEITSTFGVSFPYDLRAFLQTALPISTGFVNWRMALIDEKEKESINKRLFWPLEGILFDVHNNSFWYDEWGEKPDKIEDKIKIAKQYYRKYPVLIPIYSHRYIPSFPIEEGNPIFSVYQSDIVYYGNDLISYFCNEFKINMKEYNVFESPKYIEFWGRIAEGY